MLAGAYAGAREQKAFDNIESTVVISCSRACLLLGRKTQSMAVLSQRRPKKRVKPNIPDALKLVAMAGPNEGTTYSKPGAVLLTIGRTRNSKLHIKDPAVSEKHGQLTWSNGCWLLQDVGSSNGTALNGKKLESEGEAVPLKDGDMILFGTDSLLRVEVTPIHPVSVTVEQHLQAECQRMIHHTKARYEQLASTLKEEWELARRQLVAEAAVGS